MQREKKEEYGFTNYHKIKQVAKHFTQKEIYT